MQKPITSNALRNRPRFKAFTKLSIDEFTLYLKEGLSAHKRDLDGRVNREEAVIYVKVSQDKYWSPHLQIRCEKDEDNPDVTVIRGIFGPSTPVWTFFMFMYGLGAAVILTTGLYGFSQLLLGIDGFWIWTNLLGVAMILGTYTAAQIGKRLSKQEMSILETFIEVVLIRGEATLDI